MQRGLGSGSECWCGGWLISAHGQQQVCWGMRVGREVATRIHSIWLLDGSLAGAHLGAVAEAVWLRVTHRLQKRASAFSRFLRLMFLVPLLPTTRRNCAHASIAAPAQAGIADPHCGSATPACAQHHDHCTTQPKLLTSLTSSPQDLMRHHPPWNEDTFSATLGF